MQLLGKPVAEKMKTDLIDFCKDNMQKGSYVAILLTENDGPSKVYINMKVKFGNEIGLDMKVFGAKNIVDAKFPLDYMDCDLESVLQKIEELNNDQLCVGIVVQLPLADNLKPHKAQILSKVDISKDLDGLGGKLFGLSSIDLIDFLPATPMGVIKLLEFYNLDNLESKKVLIIGQSNLVGKPLAMECIKRGAEVFSVNHLMKSSQIAEIALMSDFIFSATGQIHLVDESFVREDKTQIVIDIGYGIRDGKAFGDVNSDKISDKVLAYSPVPGGAGAVTIACIFENLRVLKRLRDQNII